eukprot:Ihof_evm2s25 gene=Ihof_evmTU2s25
MTEPRQIAKEVDLYVTSAHSRETLREFGNFKTYNNYLPSQAQQLPLRNYSPCLDNVSLYKMENLNTQCEI